MKLLRRTTNPTGPPGSDSGRKSSDSPTREQEYFSAAFWALPLRNCAGDDTEIFCAGRDQALTRVLIFWLSSMPGRDRWQQLTFAPAARPLSQESHSQAGSTSSSTKYWRKFASHYYQTFWSPSVQQHKIFLRNSAILLYTNHHIVSFKVQLWCNKYKALYTV